MRWKTTAGRFGVRRIPDDCPERKASACVTSAKIVRDRPAALNVGLQSRMHLGARPDDLPRAIVLIVEDLRVLRGMRPHDRPISFLLGIGRAERSVAVRRPPGELAQCPASGIVLDTGVETKRDKDGANATRGFGARDPIHHAQSRKVPANVPY